MSCLKLVEPKFTPWTLHERLDTYYYDAAARLNLWIPKILGTDVRQLGLRLTLDTAMLGVGGGLYLVGVVRPEINIDLNIFSAIGRQKCIQGVNFGSTNFKHDIPMYAELYLQGRMNLDDLVSKKIALRDVNDGYAALKDGSLNRVVVTSFNQ